MGHRMIQGDCLEVLPTLAEASVDSIVTDPPYGIKFMSKTWDHGIPGVPFWEAALRVAKPGAYLLAFGGTRTYHRLCCAIEDAGWEIRDCLMWVYGSGFPKSHDIGKAIDKAAGAEREVVGSRKISATRPEHGAFNDDNYKWQEDVPITAPATDAAKQWDGWGTALKPAYEPIIVARKPLIGTVAANVQKHGTGGLNIDGCRVGTTKDVPGSPCKTDSEKYGKGSSLTTGDTGGFNPNIGRWPANLIHDGSDEVLDLFAAFGEKRTGKGGGADLGYHGGGSQEADKCRGFGDSGSAARFFYCAKASKADRNEGLDDTCIVKYNVPIGGTICKDATTDLVRSLRKATSGSTVTWLIGESGGSITGLCPSDSLSTTLTAISKITPSRILNSLTPSLTSAFTRDANSGADSGGSRAESAESPSTSIRATTSESQESVPGASRVVSLMLSALSNAENWKPLTNFHSTVKPHALMRYLCRLVTPPGGTVLDPFAGSGSTGKAAVAEGFGFVGVELSPEYCDIARARIASAQPPEIAPDGIASPD